MKNRNTTETDVAARAARFEIYLVATPGIEDLVCAEARTAGFATAKVVEGGISFEGTWADVWRANLLLRTPTRVLARLGSFPVSHLAQLDKKASAFAWAKTLERGTPFRVEATCRKSKIYHSGAAAQRVAGAISEAIEAPLNDTAAVTIMARIEKNICTLSIDTSGESLHKRGHKEAIGKAPMRETLAAAFLRASGYTGHEPVLDPMCGSGTFVLEAAEIAMGLAPGRDREFAFEHFKSFDPVAWQALKLSRKANVVGARFYGYDRDAGAIAMSKANADRAGVLQLCSFQHQPIGTLEPPDGPPGLVIINPPYGARIGNKKPLHNLHAALGEKLKAFSGWRIGLITTDEAFVKSTGLPFEAPSAWINHGGLRIRLYLTKAL